MTDRRKLRGKEGEKESVEYLTSKGYEVLETNWKHHPQEIDIICKHKNELVFVEVKYRIEEEPVMPRHAVSRAQQQALSKAANAYIEKQNWEGHARFDVIMITQLPSGKQHLAHFEEAFFPSEV